MKKKINNYSKCKTHLHKSQEFIDSINNKQTPWSVKLSQEKQGKRFSQAVVSNLPIKSSCNQRTFISIKEKELLINAFYSNKSVKQKSYDKNYIEKNRDFYYMWKK